MHNVTYIINSSHQEEDDAEDVQDKDGSEKDQHDDDCAAEREVKRQTCYTTLSPLLLLLCNMNITGTLIQLSLKEKKKLTCTHTHTEKKKN